MWRITYVKEKVWKESSSKSLFALDFCRKCRSWVMPAGVNNMRYCCFSIGILPYTDARFEKLCISTIFGKRSNNIGCMWDCCWLWEKSWQMSGCAQRMDCVPFFRATAATHKWHSFSMITDYSHTWSRISPNFFNGHPIIKSPHLCVQSGLQWCSELLCQLS